MLIKLHVSYLSIFLTRHYTLTKKLEVKVKTIALLHAISICNGFIEVLAKVISEMISETLEQLLGVHKVKCIFKIIFEHYVPLLLGCN